MSIEQQQQIADPSLEDVLENERINTLRTINCCHIGTIQSFDPVKKFAKVTINYQRTYFVKEGNDPKYRKQLVDYPILSDVPVFMLTGGTGALTMAPAAGDQCLILFNDRDINLWKNGARTGAPQTGRMHSFSDPIALCGLSAISDFDPDRAVLRKGEAKVGVSATKIQVENDSQNLKDLLVALIDAIKSISVSPGTFTAGVTPVTGSGVISGGSQSTLQGIADDIEELLE